jgi:hypothetical protein
MVGLSAVCWALWKTRNAICFDKKRIRSPTEIICLASSFLTFWAGLHNDGNKKLPEEGAKALKEAARAFHTHAVAPEDHRAGIVLLQ